MLESGYEMLFRRCRITGEVCRHRRIEQSLGRLRGVVVLFGQRGAFQVGLLSITIFFLRGCKIADVVLHGGDQRAVAAFAASLQRFF